MLGCRERWRQPEISSTPTEGREVGGCLYYQSGTCQCEERKD